MKFTRILLFALLSCLSAGAVSQTDSVTVRFRQSHIGLDPQFAGNGERLDSIFNIIRPDTMTRPSRYVKEVRVLGAASPEGSVVFNNYLSEKRAAAIFDSFRRRHSKD